MQFQNYFSQMKREKYHILQQKNYIYRNDK